MDLHGGVLVLALWFEGRLGVGNQVVSHLIRRRVNESGENPAYHRNLTT